MTGEHAPFVSCTCGRDVRKDSGGGRDQHPGDGLFWEGERKHAWKHGKSWTPSADAPRTRACLTACLGTHCLLSLAGAYHATNYCYHMALMFTTNALDIGKRLCWHGVYPPYRSHFHPHIICLPPAWLSWVACLHQTSDCSSTPPSIFSHSLIYVHASVPKTATRTSMPSLPSASSLHWLPGGQMAYRRLPG